MERIFYYLVYEYQVCDVYEYLCEYLLLFGKIQDYDRQYV